MVKLYDSLSQQLKEIDEQQISIYNCGPTVYNHIHIGNARPLITFDVLYRLFLHLNKEVKYVLNITDIDDKIINAAIENNQSELELSNYYAQQYFLIRKKLNVLEMINPKVSDNIDGIIAYIDKLMQCNAAYFAQDGDVYFDTSSISNYGCVSHQKSDFLQHGARVEVDHNKKNEQDFVLWKKTEKGIQWDTKWFKGRPGWHTECSYLINKLIGEQVTIHGGGMDLKFPHHENENAQNIALYNCDLSKVWLHVGMININNEKMSKSLNNFILVKDILNKYSYQALRWFFYQTAIANPLNYSDEVMMQMENEVNKLFKTINKARSYLIINKIDNQLDLNTKNVNQELIEQLSNNLNFSNSITIIYQIAKKLNQFIDKKSNSDILVTLNELISSLNLLGIEFDDLYTDEVIQKLHTWKDYHDRKEFEQADKLRAELIKLGILN